MKLPGMERTYKNESRLSRLTLDLVFQGRLRIWQPEYGYRFSIDPVLLAGSVKPLPGDRIVDLGAGCGIMSLVIAHRNPEAQLVGIEVQTALADIARLNVIENGMAERIRIIEGDLKDLKSKDVYGPADLLVTNPPYGRIGSGRLGADLQQAVARHEIAATLDDFLKAAARILKVSGKLAIIYPAKRLTDLLYHLRILDLEPRWLRTVHPGAGNSANRVLVHAIKKGGPGLEIGPPLILHGPGGSYTNEVWRMFNP